MKILLKPLALLIFGIIVLTTTACNSNNIANSINKKTLINDQFFALEENQSIEIESTSDGVFILDGNSDEVEIKEYVSSESTSKTFVSYENDADTLSIKTKDNNENFQIVGNNEKYIEIYLPKTHNGTISAKTTSADITMNSSGSVADITLASTSGDILVNDISESEVRATSDSGSITINPLDSFSYTFKLATKSGELKINSEDVFYNEDETSAVGTTGKNPRYRINAETRSGDITLN